MTLDSEELDVEEQPTYRQREVVSGDYFQTLLNSLNLDEIRAAAYIISPSNQLSIKSHSDSRSSLLKLTVDKHLICRTLLRIEQQNPFKHCLFFKCSSIASSETLRAAENQSLENSGHNFRIVYAHEDEDQVCVTLEHHVRTREWVNTDEDNRTAVYKTTRHPIIFRVKKILGTASLSYPGYSQGQAIKKNDVIHYDVLLNAALQVIKSLQFESQVVPVRNAISTFLASGENKRVSQIRADIEPAGGGRFDVSSPKNNISVEKVVSNLLGPHLAGLGVSLEQLEKITRVAVNSSDANSMLLYWHKEEVFTRLKFWDIGCEIFFVWHGSPSTYGTVDAILDVLIGAFDHIGRFLGASATDPLGWILLRDPETIIKPAAFAEGLGLATSQARTHLMYAVNAGIVVPVYRLNIELNVIGYSNEWTTDLSSLRKNFENQKHATIDGSSAKNIEVAFQRVGTVVGDIK